MPKKTLTERTDGTERFLKLQASAIVQLQDLVAELRERLTEVEEEVAK